MSLPPEMEAMRLTAQGRLKLIEERLAALEAFAKKWEAEMAMRDVGITPGPAARGCTCPPGSEATCVGYGCPRRASPDLSPGVKAFVF